MRGADLSMVLGRAGSAGGGGERKARSEETHGGRTRSGRNRNTHTERAMGRPGRWKVRRVWRVRRARKVRCVSSLIVVDFGVGHVQVSTVRRIARAKLIWSSGHLMHCPAAFSGGDGPSRAHAHVRCSGSMRPAAFSATEILLSSPAHTFPLASQRARATALCADRCTVDCGLCEGVGGAGSGGRGAGTYTTTTQSNSLQVCG